MKRTQDKIRDFVEPQAFDELHDFAADPARALAAYRFTDATSDLLARWLDSLADLPRGRGAAQAVAGLRGVGKSHSLAVFGALVASAQLRSTVSDAHVATSARRLMNRRHTVVRVERGTRQTLGEELAAALGKAFGGRADDWSGEPAGVLRQAAARAQGATVVVLVDTAYGRAARVARDDGPQLAALATAARDLEAFIGLALDDDIAGAEGVNVALSQTFRIDYLEPEHLYHVANNYLLRKSPPARDRLHDIYLALRSSVPNFNWSEPRFAALYPIHPLVADVAASVRLHAHSFAFLPFAAAASLRAMGRPALSLILLDEVFDQTEKELRTAKDLKDAFAVYDELSANAVAQFPAIQRLQVRLVLKNLLVMSLDGRGATARDLCAALLLEDDAAAHSPVERVEETLRRLEEHSPPGGIVKTAGDGGEVCYRFQLSASDAFDAALARVVKLPLADARAVPELLAGLARIRFADWPLAEQEPAVAPAGADSSEAAGDAGLSVVWRGTLRRGRLLRRRADEASALPAAVEGAEWEVFVLEPGADAVALAAEIASAREREASRAAQTAPVCVVWQPAELTAEEWGLLRRLHALRTEASLASFGESARIAATTLTARAERVWTRLYVDDGALIIDGGRSRFTAGARSNPKLAGVLGQALAPFFDARYPQHPDFAATLCEPDAARLVEGFFSGANPADPAVQQLAEQFAHPLGLATLRGSTYAPAAGDETLSRHWTREVLSLVDRAGNQTVPDEEVRRALSRQPTGLTAESRHLVLAALVAARRIELVTPTGDRISRRTLGRAISWADVAGISRPASIRHSAEELTEWARRLTGRSDLPAVTTDAACEAVRAALDEWLAGWRSLPVLRDFDALPDAGLTMRTWKLAAFVRRTFEAAAEAVETSAGGDLALEEVLQRVADAFASSPEEFARAARQLEDLTAYTEGVVARERARAYLTAAEPTGVGEIESARRELLHIADDPHTLLDADSRARFDLLWNAFRERYGAHYVEAHEGAVGAAPAHRQAVEELTRTEEWREFESLAGLPFVSPRPWREAAELLSLALSARCALPVARLLAERPRCACRFRLSDAAELENVAARLAGLAARGRASYRRTLAHFGEVIVAALEHLARDEADAAAGARARALAHSFAQGQTPRQLSGPDASIIARALASGPSPTPYLRLQLPPDLQGLSTRDELQARVGAWLEELPRAPALVELVSEGEPNAAGQPVS